MVLGLGGGHKVHPEVEAGGAPQEPPPQENVESELEHAAKGLEGAVKKRRTSKCERRPSPRPEHVVPVVMEVVEVVEGPTGEEQAVLEIRYGDDQQPEGADIQRLVGEITRKKSGQVKDSTSPPLSPVISDPASNATPGLSEGHQGNDHVPLIIVDTASFRRAGTPSNTPTARSSSSSSPPRRSTGSEKAHAPSSSRRLDKHEAAIHIERVVRGGVARRKVTKARAKKGLRALNLAVLSPVLESTQELGEENSQDAAAQNIQKIIRGGVARKKVKKLKDEKADQAIGGYEEEKAERAHKGLDPLVVVSDSVAHPFRLYDDYYHEAAQSIQKVVRGGTTRKRLRRQRSDGQEEEIQSGSESMEITGSAQDLPIEASAEGEEAPSEIVAAESSEVAAAASETQSPPPS